MSDLTSYPCLARKGRHLYRIGACPHCEAKRLRSEVATLEASRQQIFKAADIEIEQLRAELAASREREARTQWQPIETSPKDGSYLLVSNGHGVWVARFKSVYQSGWEPPSPWQSMMLNHDHIPRAKRNGNPTHWMPLPTALAEGSPQ